MIDSWKMDDIDLPKTHEGHLVATVQLYSGRTHAGVRSGVVIYYANWKCSYNRVAVIEDSGCPIKRQKL